MFHIECELQYKLFKVETEVIVCDIITDIVYLNIHTKGSQFQVTLAVYIIQAYWVVRSPIPFWIKTAL
jgi:hypothetical protein